MASKSDIQSERPRPGEPEATIDLTEGHERNERPLGPEHSRTSQSVAQSDGIQVPAASEANPCMGQEFRGQEEHVITNIRATAVVLGLRRLSAGFYTIVRHSGLEWRTENKCSSVKDDVVEWSGPIPIPSDPLTSVCLEVYASFEFQPELGNGEQLQQLTVTVKQLLDHSENHVPFTFFPNDGDVVSPCSSIVVVIERRSDGSRDSLTSRLLDPLPSTTNTDKLKDATNHGHSALSRYRKHGEKRDLEYSVAQFELALNSCPPNHACRGAAESNLASAKFILHQVEGTNTFFEIPLGLYQDALTARPVGHADRSSTLIRLATVHLARYEERGDTRDGAQVEAFLHEVTGLRFVDSHESRIVSFVLELYASLRVGPHKAGNQPSVDSLSGSRLSDEDPWMSGAQLLQRFKRYGDLADLERAITLLQKPLESFSVWDGQYRERLGNLGVALLWRFQRLGELGDLEAAISTFRDVVHVTPDGNPYKLGCLNNLAGSLIARFERLGGLSDLEDGISTHRHVNRLTPDDHPDKPRRLNNLGLSSATRFDRLGELNDLEDAISTHRQAVHLTPDGHPDKPGRLSNLGNTLGTRFDRLGELSDLEDAISTLRHAVHLTPDGHPDNPRFLSNLGLSFITRFERLGELRDLDNGISTHRHAVHLIPNDHPDMPRCLNSLGLAFRVRFDRLGKLSDLEDAALAHRFAVHLTPDGHPSKPGYLNNLGLSFRARFERLGELSDLEAAISTFRGAVHLTPDGHPDMQIYLNNLGNTFITRFERLGELSDLEDAISTHKHAVHLTPDGHLDKPRRLHNLGNTFITRFHRFGELSDLEDAISTYRHVVHLTPDGHPDKPLCLKNLGNSFFIHFDRLGELSDLENAISIQRHALHLIPDDHPDKPSHLNSLGNSLFTRFKRLEEPSDLEDAISMHRHAVHLTPDDHPDKPRHLNNLGLSVRARFHRLGELRDLEDVISTHRHAVHLTPDGHFNKPGRLDSLGNSLITRFHRLGELSDLEDGISTYKYVVYLTPDGHPHKPLHLSNLGLSFIARFDRFGKLRDLEHAISTHRHAVHLTPDGHPDKPHYLNNLGSFFRTLFDCLGEQSDLTTAISLYSHSASSPVGPVRVRLRASCNWISCARRIHHPSLLRAYSVAIRLLPQCAWIGLSLAHRYAELKHSAYVVREAAAAALESGFPELAVEWLEQGRSIVWGELLQLRDSYEQLSSAHPEHARKLRELSAALDNAGATREQSFSEIVERIRSGFWALSASIEHPNPTDTGSFSLFSETTRNTISHARGSLQHAVDRQRTLALERDKLLQEIRRLPGFEQFLFPKDFSQLRASAHSGPVVVLNAADTRCDALIVLRDVNHVIHVPLPDFDVQRSTHLQGTLKTFLRQVFVTREGKSARWDHGTWESFLAPLWKCIVKPIVDGLAFSIPGDLSRIFWCPTGPFVFLPLHAAGLYGDEYSVPGHKVFDFVVSSYVPTLSILAPSRNIHVLPEDDFRLLAVRQPSSDGLSRLPGVHTELDHIKEVVGNASLARTVFLEPSAVTVEEVLGMMKESDWVHFACHGIQDATRPTDSGLCLANGRRLKISDIIGLSRSRGGLAFLSACQTAKGDEDLSDEAVHIAAGMLFAGYGGVIGTMWSISDRLAPIVAEDVYAHLFRDGTTKPDHREAAWALHEAIRRLRENNEVTFNEWVPFIHVGL